jgi:RNA polymerase sigma-70 factor, ECF subfamily
MEQLVKTRVRTSNRDFERILLAGWRELRLDMTAAEFREAYESNRDLLFRFACRMTGSAEAAEDVVHDCFLLLWRKKLVFDQRRGPLRSLLFGVTRNLALKRLGQDGSFDELAEDAAVGEPMDAEGRERAEMVAQAVAALPPLQREALILAEYEDMSLEQMVQLTGANLAAVKSRLHRAREKLKRMLGPLMRGSGTAYGKR